MVDYPRLHSELTTPDETTSNTAADYRDYTAIANFVRVPKALPFVTVGSDAGCDYVTNGSNEAAQLQAAHDALTTGGCIKLIPPFIADDAAVTISNSCITIKSEVMPHRWSDFNNVHDIVYIDNLMVSSAARQVDSINLEGLNVRLLKLSHGAFSLRDVHTKNSYFYVGSASDGIKLEASAGGAGAYMDSIFLDDSLIINESTDGATSGAITAVPSGGAITPLQNVTNLQFNRIIYNANANNTTLFYSGQDAEIDDSHWNNTRFFVANGLTGSKMFYAKSPTTNKRHLCVDYRGGVIEAHSALSVLTVDDNATNVYERYHELRMHDILGTTGTIVFLADAMHDMYSNNRYLAFYNNHVGTGFTVGEPAYWESADPANFFVYGNVGYNDSGVIANPISSVRNTRLVDAGASASFGSGTTYSNTQSPKTIHIYGGTVSDIKHNGVTIQATTNCHLLLAPNDTFSVTSSAPPTIVVMKGW